MGGTQYTGDLDLYAKLKQEITKDSNNIYDVKVNVEICEITSVVTIYFTMYGIRLHDNYELKFGNIDKFNSFIEELNPYKRKKTPAVGKILERVGLLNIDLLTIERFGRYYGYPVCCIMDYKKGYDYNDRKLKETGYVPCEKCNEKTYIELVDQINSSRSADVAPFPLLHNIEDTDENDIIFYSHFNEILNAQKSTEETEKSIEKLLKEYRINSMMFVD